jgi:hypothetical protein
VNTRLIPFLYSCSYQLFATVKSVLRNGVRLFCVHNGCRICGYNTWFEHAELTFVARYNELSVNPQATEHVFLVQNQRAPVVKHSGNWFYHSAFQVLE